MMPPLPQQHKGVHNMALNIQGTPEAAKAWAPDKVAFKPEEVIPDALLLKASSSR